MRAIVIVGLLLIAAPAMGASAKKVRHQKPAGSAIFASAKRHVANELRDPSSAQFRELRQKVGDDGRVRICGEINGKNAYGGYVGFAPFAYFPDSQLSYIGSNSDDISNEQRSEQNAILGECFY